MLGLGTLEISFIVLVSAMSVAAGLFAVYVVIQAVRNPGVRRRASRAKR